MTTHIKTDQWNKALTYAQYRQLIDELQADNKTTGPDQSAAMLEYTRMNVVRMNRIDKTTRLTEETREVLSSLERPTRWLTITEAWCGDAAQIVPVVELMAAACPTAEHRVVLRDENLELIDAFLTNGGRAIPITVVFDAQTMEVLGHWGPRPADAQALMHEAKARMAAAAGEEEKKAIFTEVKTDLQRWYAADKTIGIQLGLTELLARVAQPVQTAG